jgi:hypothetical protein
MPGKRNDTDSEPEEMGRIGPLLDHLDGIIRSGLLNKFMRLTRDEDERPMAPPKRVLTSLPVEEGDADTTFVMLLTQPGFEEWQSQLEQLQKSIQLWQQQGLSNRQIYANLHVAIFSEDEEIAEHFTKCYHAFLRACGVLPLDGSLHRIDGASSRSTVDIEQMQNGMYLISEAGKFSPRNDKNLAAKMQSADTVVVASYIDMKQEELPTILEGLFQYLFDLMRAGLNVAVKAVLKMLTAWSKEQYGGQLQFEGGLNGQHVEVFARRIARRKGSKKRMKANLEDELSRVKTRQTARLLQERAQGSTPDKFFISQSDLLGVPPDIAAFQSKPWQELQALVGLEGVKASLESFLNGLLVDHHRELKGEKPLRSGLSKLFIGPPGTGKPTKDSK